MCESPSGTDNAVGIERGVGVSEVHAEAIATTRSKIVVIASSRTFMSRIIHGGVCVNAIDKPLERAVRFFFCNTQLSLELWNVIAGVSGFDDT
jgi:hypothetical protein